MYSKDKRLLDVDYVRAWHHAESHWQPKLVQVLFPRIENAQHPFFDTGVLKLDVQWLERIRTDVFLMIYTAYAYLWPLLTRAIKAGAVVLDGRPLGDIWFWPLEEARACLLVMDRKRAIWAYIVHRA